MIRMPDDRLPKQLLYGELCYGKQQSKSSRGPSEMEEDCRRCQQWCPYDPDGSGTQVTGKATENDQLVGKINASMIPLRSLSQASTLMSLTGKSVPRIDPCGAVSFIPEQEQQKQTVSLGSEKARCSQSDTLFYHQHLSRPDIPMPRVWKSAEGHTWTD